MSLRPRPYAPALLALAVAAGAAAPALAGKPGRQPGPADALTPEALTDEQVVAALNKGIDYLFSRQKDGKWESEVYSTKEAGSYEGGFTSLCVYTLLHVGESLQDPRLSFRSKELAPAVDYLKKLQTNQTYVKAMQTLSLAMAGGGAAENALTLKAVAQPLISSTPPSGGYVYHLNESSRVARGEFDCSASQLALLGAWGLGDAKVEVPLGYWRSQNAFWRARQNKDGGWPYAHAKPEWRETHISMSAAGVASLYILNDQLNPYNTLTNTPDKNIEAGIAYLDKNFPVDGAFDRGSPSAYYALYALERAALASGRRQFGGKDWYRHGAVQILRRQRGDGHFEQHYDWHEAKSDVASTCFALLFLARGRNPIAFSKLEYPGNTWNARPYDAAHVTAWMSGQFERAINWQTVPLSADPQEWQDAPILLITGSVDPKFTPADLAKFRAFIETGGMIFSTADGDAKEFTEAVQTYAAKVTGQGYEMRELPADHLIFTAWGKAEKPVRLLGLSNGARELWVHSPADMGKTWQRRAMATPEHFTVPANLYFYAAGAKDSLAPRLKALGAPKADKAPALTAAVARLQYPGNWDPEPGAFKRFSAVMRAMDVADVTVTTAAVDAVNVRQARVAHLAGTARFTLSEAAVKNLQAFIAAGGTLVIDNAGGNDPFDASATALVTSLFPAAALTPVPETDPVLTGDFPGGAKLPETPFRKAALARRGANRKSSLQGVKVGGRWGILYSREDIVSGLLGTNTQGIAGYTPGAATTLMRNILLRKDSGK